MQKIHRIIYLYVVVFWAGCLTGSCVTLSSLQPDPDYWPTQGWQTTTPEAQGMDSAILAQMGEAIQKDGTRLHSLLIVRNGYLVTEAYWHPYDPEDRYTIESNTKSIIGALIGIAIDQGSLKSVHQRLVDLATYGRSSRSCVIMATWAWLDKNFLCCRKRICWWCLRARSRWGKRRLY